MATIKMFSIKALMLIIIMVMLLFLESVSSVPNDECANYAAKRKQQHYLTDLDVRMYCEKKCDNIRLIDCTVVPAVGFEIPKFLKKFAERAKKVASKGEEANIEVAEIFYLTTDYYVFWKTVRFFTPYTTALIPMVMNGWLGKGPTLSGLCFLYLIIMLGFYFDNYLVLCHTFIYAYVGATTAVGPRTLGEVATYLMYPLILGIIALTVKNLIMQLVIGMLISCIGLIFFASSFRTSKESDRLSLLIGLIHITIVARYLSSVIDSIALNNAVFAWIRVVVNGCISTGPHFSMLQNAEDSARRLVSSMHGEGEDFLVGLYFISFILFVFLSIFTRALVGAAVLHTMKFKFNVHSLSMGFYSYMIDLFGPMNTIVNLPFKDSNLRSRKVLYSILMVILFYFECTTSWEIFMFRFAFWTFDSFIGTGLQDASRFLDYDIDCGSMAFPKFGAFSFFCLDALQKVKEATDIIYVSYIRGDNAVNTKQGVALLRNDPRGMTELITVKHVLEDVNCVTFRDNTDEVKKVSLKGSGSDPVVSIPWNGGKGVNISVLSQNEVRFVNYLFLVSGKGPIAPITEFAFKNNNTEIEAYVNVMQGDSGSPVIAVLADGNVRLCGFVSRGSFSEGTGNILSTIIAYDGGSPGVGSLCVEHSIPISDIEHEAQAELRRLVEENYEEYEKFFSQLDDYGDNKDVDPDQWDGDYRDKFKKRVKDWKKDAAYRKRRIGIETVLTILKTDTAVIEQILDKLDEGSIVNFNYVRGKMFTGRRVKFKGAGL